jgi:hypothetical protein
LTTGALKWCAKDRPVKGRKRRKRDANPWQRGCVDGFGNAKKGAPKTKRESNNRDKESDRKDGEGRLRDACSAPAIWLLERGTSEIKHHQLELATGATGGIDDRTFRDSEIQQALDRIGAELHAQYVVSYSPSSKWAPGFHKITVAIDRAEVSLRARPGYYVQAGESSRPPQ